MKFKWDIVLEAVKKTPANSEKIKKT